MFAALVAERLGGLPWTKQHEQCQTATCAGVRSTRFCPLQCKGWRGPGGARGQGPGGQEQPPWKLSVFHKMQPVPCRSWRKSRACSVVVQTVTLKETMDGSYRCGLAGVCVAQDSKADSGHGQGTRSQGCVRVDAFGLGNQSKLAARMLVALGYNQVTEGKIELARLQVPRPSPGSS